ncbi:MULTISPECIES: type VI secretion system baseplate subunit TssE [unclassified Motilimonas]|uniref:type VI secretion system baseplate subunit TssE n=1 Tax=unclassified Motilimonas TaxID=2643697 RepID=UPI001E421EF6|nr:MULTISPECIES: type VI secretion system baseplate subunit TssE [unclassified Motilimonas]MCE0559217.1 type VI secretion system baseplate subunit TssE [Motilimonas sp. E26]MDO6527522.1 type VI secretion system baseplate subunit TssE [Motilimonas sp. 1_MG-2023]
MSVFDLETEEAYKVSFFQRLNHEVQPASVLSGPDFYDVVESIKTNVLNLFNARRGHSLSAPGLGLIDFNDATIGTHDLTLQIKMAIKRLIQEFEPRIHKVDVNVVNDEHDPLTLRFHLTAVLNLSSSDSEVKLDFILDGNRRYRAL